MRGLTIILVEASSEKLRGALTLAAAQAALGGRARIFAQGEAAALFRPPVQGMEDDLHADAGLPVLVDLLEEALTLGVQLSVCQTGLHLTNTDAATLDPRIAAAGPVAILQTLGEDRLLAM